MGAPKASAGGRKPRPPHEEGGESTPIPAKSRRRQKTKNSKNGSTPKSGRAKSEKGRTRKWLTEMEFHAMDTGRHETAAVIPSAPAKATCLRGDGPRHLPPSIVQKWRALRGLVQTRLFRCDREVQRGIGRGRLRVRHRHPPQRPHRVLDFDEAHARGRRCLVP